MCCNNQNKKAAWMSRTAFFSQYGLELDSLSDLEVAAESFTSFDSFF